MNCILNKLKNTWASFFNSYKFCLKLLYKANRNNFFILVAINLFSLGFPILNLYLTRTMIDRLEIAEGEVFPAFLAYAFTTVLLGVLTEFNHKLSLLHTQNLLFYINNEMIKKSAKIDISAFDIPKVYDEFTKSRENAHSLHEIVFATMTAFSNFISFIAYFALCLSYNVYLTIIAIIILIPASRFRIFYEKANYNFDKRQMNEIRKNQYRYGVLLSRQTAREIRFYNIGSLILTDFINTTKDLKNAKLQFTLNKRLRILLLSLPADLFSLSVKIKVIGRILNNNASIGDYVYIDGIFAGLITGISNLAVDISAFIGYIKKIEDFQKYFGFEETKASETAVSITQINKITFENVYFTYPKTNRLVLQNVSFSIKPNEKIMLVGVNGSGKSTIVKLLAGFYKPDRGHIFIDDIDINNISKESLRRRMSIIFQDFNVFSFTLRENILRGNDSYCDDEIISVLDTIGFDHKEYDNNDTASLDLYINKEFSEKGIVLSGGQSQKIAIAAALLRDGDILVMDEPTASLDPESENRIFSALNTHYADKSVIIITHRLAFAHKMNKIIVLDDGHIAAAGTHSDLYNCDSLYTELYNAQAQRYTNDRSGFDERNS